MFGAMRDRRPLERFARVLVSSLHTRYYRPVLEKVGLGTRAAIRGLPSIEEALWRLPVMELLHWRAWPEEFENCGAPAPERLRFLHPVRPAPQLAVAVRPEPYRRYQALTAPAEVLIELARADGGGVDVAHSLLPLTAFGQHPLTEAERDLLWAAFGVPVFEQYLGPDGQVAAAECQVHKGLHVAAGNAFWEEEDGRLLLTSLTSLRFPALRLAPGLAGHLRNSTCACGQRVWRIYFK